MPVLDPPRRAVADVLDVFGEVLAAGALATTDALSRALGSPPPSQLMSPRHRNPSTTGAGTRHDAQVVGLEGQLEAVADGAVEAVAEVMLEGAALAAALLARFVGQSNSAAPTPVRTDQRASLGRHLITVGVPDDADETEHPPQYSTANQGHVTEGAST